MVYLIGCIKVTFCVQLVNSHLQNFQSRLISEYLVDTIYQPNGQGIVDGIAFFTSTIEL